MQKIPQLVEKKKRRTKKPDRTQVSDVIGVFEEVRYDSKI